MSRGACPVSLRGQHHPQVQMNAAHIWLERGRSLVLPRHFGQFLLPRVKPGEQLVRLEQTGVGLNDRRAPVPRRKRLTERWRVQFRAEAFNLANYAVLSNPDASLGEAKSLGGNGNFGKYHELGYRF